jgi:hypothetical protein
MSRKDILAALKQVPRNPASLSPQQFDELAVNSQGVRSRIGRYRATSVHKLQTGRAHPLSLAIPAYQKETTDGSGTAQTFALSHDVIDSPATEPVVVWLGGDYYGAPDSIDFETNEITVTGPGAATSVHIYYVSSKAATFEIRKSVPGSSSDSSERLYEGNLGLIHTTNQSEQPEYFHLSKSELQPFLGTDMTLDVYLKAPYTVRFEDGDGDETYPTNSLLTVPVLKGQSTVPGLTGLIKQDMGSR